MNKRVFFAKIIGAQILAYGISAFLVTYIFLGPVPVVRTDIIHEASLVPGKAIDKVKNLPAVVSSAVRSIAEGRLPDPEEPGFIPPPWEFTPQPGDVTSTPRPLPTNDPNTPNTPDTPPDPGTDPQPTQGSQPSQPNPTARFQLPRFPTFPPRPTTRPTNAPPTAIPANPSSLESQVVQIINQRRQAGGVGALSVDGSLTTAARQHSQYMSSGGGCSHTGSGGSQPPARARDAGFRGAYVGETIACGYRTAESVVDGWWSSPPHKSILMDRSGRLIGLGWHNNYQTAVVGR